MNRRAAGLACGLLIAVGAAGCGGGSDSKSGSSAGVSALPPNVSVRTADCSFWVRATPAQKTVLVQALGNFYTATNTVDVPGKTGNKLPLARATDVLTRECEPTYAAGFKLYKLYGRAAGFSTPGA